jgi:hypothetical protein
MNELVCYGLKVMMIKCSIGFLYWMGRMNIQLNVRILVLKLVKNAH